MAFRDIRKSHRFLSVGDVAFILGALILVGAVLSLNIYLARTLTGGEWLFLRWNGVRAFLFEHIEPYGSTIAQRVQEFAYGREAFLNEYPYALNDPFYVVLLYTPLALISDFAIARGIWMLFSQAALIGIVLLSLDLSEWEPPRWMFILMIGLGLFNYFSVSAWLSASPAIFLTLIYLLVLTALRSHADELAGALLFLAAYQWEVGALFFLFVLVYVFANRRWNVLVGFGMALLFFLIVSFLSNSGWAISYIRAVLFDWVRGMNYTFGITFSYLFPDLNFSIDRWISITGAVLLLFEAIRSINEHSRHVIWVAFLSLAINPMMGFAIFPSNHIALLPPLILVIGLVWERWTRRRAVVSVLLISIIFLFYFDLYFETFNEPARLYSELLMVLPPFLTLLALYWMRWWAIRPPRIWADQFGTRK